MKKASSDRAKAKPGAVELAFFRASDFLDSEEVIAEYLAAAQDDPDALIRAVANVSAVRSSGA